MVIASQVIIRVTGVGFAIYVTRRLGSEGYGLYSLITSFIALFSFPADLGLSTYTAREIARSHEQIFTLASNTAVLRLLIAPVIVCSACLVAIALNYPSRVVTGVIVASLGFLVLAIQSTLGSMFIGQERLWFTATTELANRMVFMAIAYVALIWYPDFLVVIVSLLISNLAALGLSVFLTKKSLGKIRVHIQPQKWGGMLIASMPIAVLFIAFSLALRFDTIVLKSAFGDATVGWYSAAYDIIFGLFIVAQGINTAVFATACRLMVTNPDSVAGLGQTAVKALLIFALPCATGGFLVALDLVVVLFSVQFASTGPILRILLLALPVRFLVGLADNLSIAMLRSWKAAIVTLVSSLINIGLNLWLTPKYGTLVAAFISVACESFSLMFLLVILKDLHLLQAVYKVKWGLLLALLSMAGAVWALPMLHVFLRISIGGLVYGVVLVASGALSLKEVKHLIQPHHHGAST